MILFRYLDLCAGLATLKNGTLKLTPPFEFNDPFEMAPVFALDLTGEVLRQAYLEFKALGKIPTDWSFERFKRESAAGDTNARNRGAQEEHYRGINESLGAVCFCKKPDSLPMWAYYAQHHTGMVIGFDANHHDFPYQYRNMLCDVRYEEQRPRLTHLYSPNDHHYHTKSWEWRHEGEVRILMPFDMPWVQHGQVKGKNAYFIPFPKSVVHTIYFGCRMPEERQQEVMARLSAWGYERIRQIRFVPDSTAYRLVEQELDLE